VGLSVAVLLVGIASYLTDTFPLAYVAIGVGLALNAASHVAGWVDKRN
jgi:hypothetical protein